MENDDGFYKREYQGLHTNFQYRIGDRWNIGANYTYSKSKGNFDGETSSSGAVQGTWHEYTEYRSDEWNHAERLPRRPTSATSCAPLRCGT